MRRIGQRDGRDLARAVIARNHRIAGMGPAVSAVCVRGRPAVANLRPPRRCRSRNRIELDAVAGATFTASGDRKDDRGTAIYIGQTEASVIEFGARDRRGGPAAGIVQASLGANQRVTNETERGSSFPRHSRRGGVPEEVSQTLTGPRAKVDHPAPRRVPRLSAREIDVDVVFI